LHEERKETVEPLGNGGYAGVDLCLSGQRVGLDVMGMMLVDFLFCGAGA
jgi:hypothetical protein